MLTLPSPGSGPDVDKTLASRKTPRLPPPRASTPKHTNIGSPKRASTGRPFSHRASTALEANETPAHARSQLRPNRVLNFGGESGVIKSIESPSPFKPRHALRRSTGVGHSNPFASPAKGTSSKIATSEDNVENSEPLQLDDEPLILGDDEDYNTAPDYDDEPVQLPAVEESTEKRRPGRPRKSNGSLNSSQIQHTPPVAQMSSSRKRDRSTLEGSHIEEASISQISESARAQKKRRGRSSATEVIVHQDDGDIAIDPALLAHGDEYVVEEPIAEEPEAPVRGKGKGKAKATKSKAPKERDPNRAMRAQSTQVAISDSPSKLRNKDRREGSRSLSVGPISNVHLRASTPFEDASGRTSRYGRNLNAPMKWWANEMRIWKNGETVGIVRADPVEAPKRKGRKPRKKKRAGRMADGEEDSETESVMADEWEEEVGVIAGDVANWDPERQQGDPEDLVREGMQSRSLYLPA